MNNSSVPTLPKLQRVEWLIEALNLDTRAQAYDIIYAKQIPDDCVVRVGRRVRIVEEKTIEWIRGGCKMEEAQT